jgi:hypothetical protein
MLDLAERSMSRVTGNGARHSSVPTRTLNRVSALMRRQLCVDLPPERLFGEAGTAPAGTGAEPVKVERMLFVMSHERPEIAVRPIDPSAVAERMLFSLLEESERLFGAYRRFRFAFPRRRSELLERWEEAQRTLLHEVMAGLPAFEVRHPYPVSLPALHDALREVCE